jgi:sugar lactone lactonase YvrE
MYIHWVLGIATLLGTSALAQSQAGIPGVVAAGVQPELVQEGFVFTEGPVGTADGGLFFSDLRANRTERLDPSGRSPCFASRPTARMASH